MLNTNKFLLGASLLSSAMGVYSQNTQANFKPLNQDKNVKPRNIHRFLREAEKYWSFCIGIASCYTNENISNTVKEFFAVKLKTSSFFIKRISPDKSVHSQHLPSVS